MTRDKQVTLKLTDSEKTAFAEACFSQGNSMQAVLLNFTLGLIKTRTKHVAPQPPASTANHTLTGL